MTGNGWAGFAVSPAAIVARCVNGCVIREDYPVEINAAGECFLCEMERRYLSQF